MIYFFIIKPKIERKYSFKLIIFFNDTDQNKLSTIFHISVLNFIQSLLQ